MGIVLNTYTNTSKLIVAHITFVRVCYLFSLFDHSKRKVIVLNLSGTSSSIKSSGSHKRGIPIFSAKSIANFKFFAGLLGDSES